MKKYFFDHFSNVHHFYTTFLDCYKVIHVAEAAFINDCFKISPGGSKTWKKIFSSIWKLLFSWHMRGPFMDREINFSEYNVSNTLFRSSGFSFGPLLFGWFLYTLLKFLFCLSCQPLEPHFLLLQPC